MSMDSPVSQMEAPTVSVVMPVYNAAKYLAQCMDSLLAQTFTDFEVLAFDDGSSDGSIEMLQRYAEADARVHVHLREHCGYTPHLNEGIEIARGRYIARMDSDDICLPNRFETQVRFLNEHEEVIAVGSSTVLIDEYGDPYSILSVPVDHDEIDRCHLYYGGGVLPHPSAMMRRTTIQGIGGYRPDFEPSEDLDLWLRVAEEGKLANIADPLIRYRVHGTMTSQTRSLKQRQNMLRAMNEALARRGIEKPDTQKHPQVDNLTNEGDSSPLQFASERMKTALANGFSRTAFRYALRQARLAPLSLNCWKNVVSYGYSALRMRNSQ